MLGILSLVELEKFIQIYGGCTARDLNSNSFSFWVTKLGQYLNRQKFNKTFCVLSCNGAFIILFVITIRFDMVNWGLLACQIKNFLRFNFYLQLRSWQWFGNVSHNFDTIVLISQIPPTLPPISSPLYSNVLL